VFYVLSSIWLHQFYYLFGFLLLVLIILFLTCCEVALVLTYLQLCSEDYHWWWRSYITSGSCAFYIFLYSLYYAQSKLQVAPPDRLTPNVEGGRGEWGREAWGALGEAHADQPPPRALA
jgi:hypothetical protein